MGPFVKLGPLRDSDTLLHFGLSTIGLIIILTLALTIYGVASFAKKNQSHQMKMICKLKKAWDQFKGGFFVGACGSAGFAFICLSSIRPTAS
jgi:photosystem I subunit 11